MAVPLGHVLMRRPKPCGGRSRLLIGNGPSSTPISGSLMPRSSPQNGIALSAKRLASPTMLSASTTPFDNVVLVWSAKPSPFPKSSRIIVVRCGFLSTITTLSVSPHVLNHYLWNTILNLSRCAVVYPRFSGGADDPADPADFGCAGMFFLISFAQAATSFTRLSLGWKSSSARSISETALPLLSV